MGAVSGDDSTLSFHVTTAADLTSRPTAALQSGDRAYVASKAGTPEGPLFFIDKSSTRPVDGVGVIATNSGVGRWLSEALYGGIDELVIVANVAALTAFPTSIRSSGTLAWVQSFRCYFRLDTTSAQLPDNKTIVAAAGGGNWLRSDYRDQSWSVQASWSINPTTGNDENVGSPASPLATWAEFARRVSTLAASMTVLINGDLAEPIVGFFRGLNTTFDLVIEGVPTVVVDAGSVTTFTLPVKLLGACAQGTMTSAAVADFTPHIGRFLIAADGYVTPILGANAGAPILGHWTTPFYDNDQPANGTQVNIVDLPTATTLQLTMSGVGLVVKYMKFTATSYGEGVNVSSTVPSGTSVAIVNFFGCEFAGVIATTFYTYYMACQLSDGSGGLGYVPILDYSTSMWMGGGSRDRTWNLMEGGHTQFQGFIVQGGGGVEIGFPDHQSHPSSIGAWGEDAGLGIFGSSTHGLTVSAAASVTGKTIYGAGNTGYGMNVLAGGRVNLLTVGGSPTITGALGDLRFDGAANAIPPLTPGVVVPAAAPLTTWGQWAAAPFNRRVMSYNNGACLSMN